MPNKPQKFWNFSLALYDAQGVAAACLELQEAYQLDVNLILSVSGTAAPMEK